MSTPTETQTPTQAEIRALCETTQANIEVLLAYIKTHSGDPTPVISCGLFYDGTTFGINNCMTVWLPSLYDAVLSQTDAEAKRADLQKKADALKRKAEELMAEAAKWESEAA
jgi:hypothetical protein